MKKYRIGVIGAGARGETFARQLYAGTERAALFGICDRDADRLGKFVTYCGLAGAKTFTNAEEFFSHSDMDAVIITTPDFTHRDVAIQAMRAGKHVYLEKPVAPTSDLCREIVCCQKETGRTVFVGFNLRAKTESERLKQIVDSGILGQIIHIEGLEQLSVGHSASFMRRFHRKRENTGIVQLWPGDPPNLVAGGHAEFIENDRHKNVSRPQLFVYLPPKEKQCGVSIIICAGGGYTRLSMGIHVENVVRLLHDQGIAVFGLKYRTQYGENDVVADALADGKRAVRLVRSRAAEWGLDPQRIGVQGYSAGANLCLNLMSYFDDGAPRASDPVERFSSRPDFCALMCPWPAQIRTIDDLPLTRNVPPTWMAIARDDTTAPPAFSQAIADRLERLQIRHDLYVVEKGGHSAFHYGVSRSEGAQWPTPFFAWLHAIGMMSV